MENEEVKNSEWCVFGQLQMLDGELSRVEDRMLALANELRPILDTQRFDEITKSNNSKENATIENKSSVVERIEASRFALEDINEIINALLDAVNLTSSHINQEV